jgi:ParB/RepB/Spo0J family partition protein
MQMAKPTLKNVKLDAITIDEGRFREDFGNITELAESIKAKGLIQPVTLTRDLHLLAGHRRLLASRQAGLTEVPAILRDVEDALDAREVELFENLHRKNFEWHEECKLLAEIDRLFREKHGRSWSVGNTAEQVDESKSGVHRKLELAQALEVIPELAQSASASDAYKTLKKLEEKVMVKELRKRQDEKVALDPTSFLRIANSNYQVADALVAMQELRNEGMVDFIECDPPYGIELNEQKAGSDSKNTTYKEIDREAYPAFLAKLCKTLHEKANRNCWMVFWYGPTHHQLVLTSLRAAGWEVDDIPAVWVKPSGQTLSPELYLARAYEPFFICRKGQPAMMKRGRINVFSQMPVPAAKKYHPTEKPVELASELLEVFTAPSSIVLVPFLGSGVTLRAAYLSGRRGFGYDLNGEYKDRFLLAVQEDLAKLEKVA